MLIDLYLRRRKPIMILNNNIMNEKIVEEKTISTPDLLKKMIAVSILDPTEVTLALKLLTKIKELKSVKKGDLPPKPL